MMPRSLWLRWQMQFNRFMRREFITLIGSAAANWPFATFAQQQDRMKLIGAISKTLADRQQN